MFHFCFREILWGQTAIVKTHILKERNQTGIAILTWSLISESAAKCRKKKNIELRSIEENGRRKNGLEAGCQYQNIIMVKRIAIFAKRISL